jgi:hypothetical protein
MGHVRMGFLPRTKQWNAIVQQLSLFGGDASVVPKITDAALSAIKKTYQAMPFDESVIKAISYLANLAFSAKQEDQIAYLNSHGYFVDNNLSIFSLVASAQRYITTENESLEINKIAKDAAMQAVIFYHEKHQDYQLNLFGDERLNPLCSIGNGAAFCELARSFFAIFTDRQIKYYVERAAASTIDNYGELEKFTSALSAHTSAIADHAFETSKIMQSFAAGWFNKHAVASPPSDEDVIAFLRTSFGKMREEFRREADGK